MAELFKKLSKILMGVSKTDASAGSVIFSDGSFLVEDNDNFFWDDTLNRLGVNAEASPNASLDVRGSAIFNENGVDVDFRIEGNTDVNLFFVDASTDRVGIGTSSPGAQLHTTKGRIVNTTRLTGNTTLDATHHNVFVDTDGGAITVTLPAGVDGTYYRIHNTGSSGNDLTITPNGTEQVRGGGAGVSQTVSDGETMILVFETTEGWW